MEINPEAVGTDWANALGSLSGALLQISTDALKRRNEAERLAQYNAGLVKIQVGFQAYDQTLRGVVRTKYVGGQSEEQRVGQMSEQELKANHADMIAKLQATLDETTTSTEAKTQLTAALAQAAVSHETQVISTWWVERNKYMAVESDQNVEQVMKLPNWSAQNKKDQVKLIYGLDVKAGVRYPDDAALFLHQKYQEIDQTTYLAGGYDAGTAAGKAAEAPNSGQDPLTESIKAANTWIDGNATNFTWAEKISLKTALKSQFVQDEELRTRANQQADDKVKGLLDQYYLENMDDPDAMLAARNQSLADPALSTKKFHNPDLLRDYTEYFDNRYRYLTQPHAVGDEQYAKWQKTNGSQLTRQLVDMRRAGISAPEMAIRIKQFDEGQDGNGVPTYVPGSTTVIDYRLTGDDYKQLMEDYGGDKGTPAFDDAIKYFSDFFLGKGKTMSKTKQGDLVRDFTNRYHTNHDMTEAQVLKMAENMAEPAAERDYESGLAEFLSNVFKGTTLYKAGLTDIANGLWTGRQREEPVRKMLAGFAENWLKALQKEYPHVGLTTAEVDTTGFYGVNNEQGTPLFYTAQHSAPYRLIQRGANTVLQMYVADAKGNVPAGMNPADPWQDLAPPEAPVVSQPGTAPPGKPAEGTGVLGALASPAAVFNAMLDTVQHHPQDFTGYHQNPAATPGAPWYDSNGAPAPQAVAWALETRQNTMWEYQRNRWKPPKWLLETYPKFPWGDTLPPLDVAPTAQKGGKS
jgi:hypothetical protein